MYDVTTNTFTTGQIRVGRIRFAAAAAGNKILFAGGTTGSPRGNIDLNTVDVFDVTTDYFTTSELSEARSFLAGAAAGNKILFAGGSNSNGYSKRVDI